MLTLWGPKGGKRYCDGLSRRSFIRVGGLAMGGLNLPGLLEAQAFAGSNSRTVGASPATKRHKSVIMVYLTGGHLAPGHVRPKARRPRGDPRRIQADRHPCPASKSASCCPGRPP